MNKKKKSIGLDTLYKAFIYVALITLAVVILVPVGWVFLASIKTNAEFYGNPWTLPASFYFQNFIDAFQKAKMGEYFINSVIVTGIALIIMLVVALPAAYVLARFNFKGRKFLNTAFMAGLFINVNYIVVPIFLMLLDADKFLKGIIGTCLLYTSLYTLRYQIIYRGETDILLKGMNKIILIYICKTG